MPLTRRAVLLGAGGLVAAAGVPGAAMARPDELVERVVVVFRDYAGWAFSHPVSRPGRRPVPASRRPDTLAVSNAAPSVFADPGAMVLLRPAVLGAMPASTLVRLMQRPGALVLSAHSGGAVSIGAESSPLARWRHLAELMALPGTPVSVLLDLGNAGADDEAIREGVAMFRQTYGRFSNGAVAITCRQGPALRIG